MTTPLYVSVKEAADTTGLSETEIRRAIYAQELLAHRRGRKILIPTEALVGWVEAGPVVGTYEDRLENGRA